ncbi:Sec-independent protein translocase protein TatB [Microvirga roseola]|uniref:Sec-independent protein translocase protein TatB n=1 Tax=Microvirga roseola TaxID=2883126 RepID=UPI001E42CC2F|nr:Sec-independent protein translocase protein TatB [Microvirga roseola]
MLDMSWGEIMMIGAVALIVIGPKDLPRALRTVGQMTGKLRRMAAEFQGQFQEAMREAELDEVKQQLKGMNDSVSSLNKGFNPIQSVRDELKTAVEAPVSGQEQKPSPEATGTALQVREEAPVPAPVGPDIPLPALPMDDPAEEIAASLRREAEFEAQKAAAARAAQENAQVRQENAQATYEKTDVKA